MNQGSYSNILLSNFIMADKSNLRDKLNRLNQCHVCFDQYNRQEKQPVYICSMHHTVCRECLAGLQVTRKCPFCRKPVNFKEIVVNSTLLQLLPSNPLKPNIRSSISNPPIQPARPKLPPSIQPQQINPPANASRPQSNRQQNQNYIPIPQNEAVNSRAQPQLSFCQNIKQRCKEFQPTIVPFVSLIFTYSLFDLLIAFKSTDHQCLYASYKSSLPLRSWLIIMGMIGAILFIYVIFGAFLALCKKVSFSTFNRKILVTSFFTWLVKMEVWAFIELLMFPSVIGPHCSGGIYAYVLIQIIFSAIIIIVALFCWQTK